MMTQLTPTRTLAVFISLMSLTSALHLIPSWASQAEKSQVGTLTQIQGPPGSVTLFTYPSRTLKDLKPLPQGSPRALFEGAYYLVKEARVGDRLENGNIIRTLPGAKARIIFDNGDQIHVGSGTSYRVRWDKGAPKGQTEIDLAYGKLRGIIEKGGPRTRLRIKTKNAVMGVRGTDFFIAHGGKNQTEVTIIRGQVEVAPSKVTPSARPMAVKAGYSAEVTKPMEPKIELRRTTQQEFTGIQRVSTLKPRPLPSQPSQPNREIQRKIEVLEKKAVQVTLKDIQVHDPKLFAAFKGSDRSPAQIEELNQAAIQSLAKEAPQAPAQHKPRMSEMEDIDDGAYERYFKKVD